MQRRDFLGAVAATGVAAGWPGLASTAQADERRPNARRGRLKQALWAINFQQAGKSTPDDPEAKRKALNHMCETAMRLGAYGFDLLPEASWPMQRSYGLTPTLAGPGGIDFETGIIHTEANEAQLAGLIAQAKVCAKADVRRVAFNAGQRRGLSYAKAADNAVALLNRAKDTFERLNVTLCMENVNDRRGKNARLGRQDMVFGHWDWGMEVVTRVDSPHIKLLCDIYHLQIMDGDVTTRIRESIGHIGHFHVAGVPTRSEPDAEQELNYHYIAQVIASLPYDGYVAHEWRPHPGHDPVEAIRQALAVMDV